MLKDFSIFFNLRGFARRATKLQKVVDCESIDYAYLKGGGGHSDARCECELEYEIDQALCQSM